MRLTVTTPSKKRAKRFGTAFGAVGSAIGSLPIGVSSGSKRQPAPLAARIGIPIVAAVAVLAGAVVVLLRGRRSSEEEAPQTWETPVAAEPPRAPTMAGVAAPPEPITETERQRAEEVHESGVGESLDQGATAPRKAGPDVGEVAP